MIQRYCRYSISRFVVQLVAIYDKKLKKKKNITWHTINIFDEFSGSTVERQT